MYYRELFSLVLDCWGGPYIGAIGIKESLPVYMGLLGYLLNQIYGFKSSVLQVEFHRH